MPHRPFLIFVLLLPLGLGSCFVGAPVEDEVYPYGQPRYGHGGSNSPLPPAAPPPPGGAPPLAGPNQPAVPGAPGGPANQASVPNPPAPGAPGGNTPGAPGAPGAPGTPGTGPAGTATGAAPGVTASSEPPPYGIPVPGKDGMLYSPFKPDAGFIDITTRNADGSTSVLPPGTKIKDPFSGKPILVP